MKHYEYYEREINYYETDQMHIVHHSNYARYLEECRLDMMKYYGLPYAMLEELGYIIPVLELHCNFVESVKYGETIRIVPKMEKVGATRFHLSYHIYDEGMQVLKHTAETVHCFLNREFKPVSLKKDRPDLYKVLLDMVDDK